MTDFQITPLDQYNTELVEHVHPPQWKNPTPKGAYNMVAIGGGTAGIISALAAAGLGGSSALVERHLLGGDCLNFGCVPSKAIIRAARTAYQIEHAQHHGVHFDDCRVDFADVMRRMRRLRAQISHHDSAQRFAGLGADVYLGEARFTGPDSIEVDGQAIKFRRCVIATGARATRPPIPGFDQLGYLTNESIFSLTELPRRLIVVGGGPIGCEMAQAFRRLGSEVHLVDMAERIMPRDDPDASEIVQQQFRRESIHLYLGAKVLRGERTDADRQLVIHQEGQEVTLEADEVLIAVGRTPNVEGLNLEAAGVTYTKQGVEVDDRLRTGNSRIYAAGDIIGDYQFTHAADAMARLCIQNAFFFGRKKLSSLVIPHCTYTDPEVAHVGVTPATAAEIGIEIDSYREELANVDRAILDGETEGFAVIHCQKGTGKIVGATIVGSHAGEMIGEMALMMTKNILLGHLGGVIHCYPTQVEVLKRIGDQFNRGRLTPLVAGLLKYILTRR